MTVAREPKMNMWFLQYCIKSAPYHRRKTFHSITLLVKNVFEFHVLGMAMGYQNSSDLDQHVTMS